MSLIKRNQTANIPLRYKKLDYKDLASDKVIQAIASWQNRRQLLNMDSERPKTDYKISRIPPLLQKTYKEKQYKANA